MLYAGGLLGTLLLLLWLFCIIDVIMTPADEARHLPKLLWLVIVVLLGAIGAAIWLLVGRPWPGGSPLERWFGGGSRRAGGGTWDREAPAYPEYDRPGRFAATNPDDDDAFLAQVRERAESQRRAEAARRREREQAETAERERRRRSAADRGAEPDDPAGPGGSG